MKYALLFCSLIWTGILSAQQTDNTVTTLESVQTFSAIRVEKGIHVYVTMGDAQSVSVAGNPKHVRVVCNGRRLRIKKSVFAPETAVYITCTDLRKIRAGYMSEISCTNMQGNELEILMDEFAQVSIQGTVQQLRVVNKNGMLQLSDNYRLGQQLYDFNGNYTDIYLSDDTADASKDSGN